MSYLANNMKKMFLLLSSIALMVLMSFNIFNAPAFAMPQDLVDWCIPANECDVLSLGEKDGDFVGTVMFYDRNLNEAEYQCYRTDTVPGNAPNVQGDWRQYFITEDGIIEYDCRY